MTQQPVPVAAGIETDLIGRTIKAVPLARAGRILQGVVLPPAPNARVPMLRLACPGRAPVRFDPDKWTITTVIHDTYQHGNLPAEHLATRTMLKTEKRMQPAKGQPVIAFYRTRDGVADLYAVADAVPMAPLPPARAAAWTAARTCIRCGQTKHRPLPEYQRVGGRLCDACQSAVAVERWAEKSRAVQAEAAEWAREILAGPNALLIARDGNYQRPAVRIEWLFPNAEGETTGDLLTVFDGRLRKVDEPPHFDDGWWTAERIDEWHRTNDGTVGPTDFGKIVDCYRDMRIIAWSDRDRWFDVKCELPFVAATDELDARLALWSGEAPFRSGNWYPEPRMPWSYHPQNFPMHTAHSKLRHAHNLAAEIASMRMLLHIIAGNPPSEPKAGPVVIVR